MNVELTGTGTGTVSSNPGTLVCTGGPQTCPATFADGTVVTFTAAPGLGAGVQRVGRRAAVRGIIRRDV